MRFSALFGRRTNDDTPRLIAKRHGGLHREASSTEKTIEAACRLIDDGYDVFGIGTGPLTASIGGDDIAVISAMWTRANLRCAEAVAIQN